MEVKTIKDLPGLPEGSVIHVEKVNKKSYRGLWSSMAGTYYVNVKKEDVEMFKED